MAQAAAVSPTPESDDASTCYKAFARRRRARGELSIRTLEGFRRLQKRYGQLGSKGAASDPAASDDQTPTDSDVVAAEQRNVVDVFFSPKIARVITETCWGLAHFGGGDDPKEQKECAGLILGAEKYSTFNFRLLQWVFPELPRKEAQQLVQNDWAHDRELDECQSDDGLSLQGFKLSLLDLVISCTDGTVNKCLECLNLMARWLQHSLPPYPTADAIPQAVKDLVEARKTIASEPKSAKPTPARIVWETIPLSVMTPCQIGQEGLYCELKAKVCSAPLTIMVLAADDNPIELLLSTNSKLLTTKSNIHAGANRKVTTANVLCGELKRQGCWTFCMNPSTPLVLTVPNESISRHRKALYAYFRAFNPAKQQESDHDVDNNDSPPPHAAASSSVTLFTSTPEHCRVRFGSKGNAPHRMERMSARVFTVDRSVTQDGSFSILVTASLLQCTSAAGGAGAAAAVSSTFEKASTFFVREDQWTDPHGDGRQTDAHTFIFLFKSTPEPVAPAKKSGLKEQEATLPQQWFTSLSAANETKTVVVERNLRGDRKNEDTSEGEPQRREVYQLFVFTLHGIFIEVSCTAVPVQTKESGSGGGDSADSEASDTDGPNALSMISQTPLTSVELLKELLLLQKMRQNQSTSEALPDLVIGTQVTTAKPVTIAESLRTKVLRSRQDECHDRFVQLEAAIRKKLVECKQQRPKSTPAQAPDTVSYEEVASPPSPTSELEKRVNLMTTFFHEMAVHQPKLDELNGSAAEAAEAAAEELLLKRFGDMFNTDEELQNTLDEEKWSTDTAKVARRRSSTATNLPRAMQAEEVTGTRDQVDEGKYPWTFEDYENTAQYIEQLMEDIETHETQQQEVQDAAEAERRHAVMTQLVASWQYTQHRVNKAATRQRVREIEQRRRSQWLQSQHVQVYGAVASAKRGDRPERPAFVLPKQRFLVQESLPSTAVWEVPGSPTTEATSLVSGALAAAGLVSPARPMSPREDDRDQTPSKILPRRPPQRPMTVATPERAANITALRSAALSRARVRRIRSAHSNCRQSRQTASSPKDTAQPEAQVAPQYRQSLVLDSHEPPPNSSETAATCLKEDSSTQLNAVPSIQNLVVLPPDDTADTGGSATPATPTHDQGELDNRVAIDDTRSSSPERSTTRPLARKKKLTKKKQRPASIVRFQRRVQELVSISAQLQADAEQERRQAQGIDELCSAVPFLATRSTKPASNK